MIKELTENIQRTYEQYDWYEDELISLGTAAVEIPTAANNVRGRKNLFVQNLHATATVWIGGCRPDAFIFGDVGSIENAGYRPRAVYGKQTLKWFASGAGTNEYYLALIAGTTPALTEPLRLFGTIAASDVIFSELTNGTVGALADHAWDWGDNDALGFNTIYIRDNTGNPNVNTNLSLLSYWKMPVAGSGTYGIKLTGGAYFNFPFGMAAKLFAIASGAATPTLVVQMG